MKKVVKRLSAGILAGILTVLSLGNLQSVSAASLNLSTQSWYEYAVVKSDSAISEAYYKMSSQGDSSYVKVDSELINGTRLDLPGLKGNTNYDIKVVGTNGATSVATVKPAMHDRSGYAHFNYSGVGAYNDDGTPKANADVVYVTNKTKNTVKYGNYTGLTSILTNKSKISNPLIIRIIGTIDTNQRIKNGYNSVAEEQLNGLIDKATSSDGYTNMCDISSAKNLTLEGIGEDAKFLYWGMTFKGCESIEVRNMSFASYPEDACSSNDGKRIWFHNNTFYKGEAAYDFSADQDKYNGDGASDFSKGNSYVTLAYNHYNNCHKSFLVSGGDSSYNYHFTIHHNFFDGVQSRCPLTRNTDIHYYNNYQKSVGGGVSARIGNWIFSENNYFEGNKNCLVAVSGTNAVIKSYNDFFNKSSLKSGVTVVTDRTKSCSNGGSKYPNFDTDTSLFYYDSANKVSDVAYMTSAEQAKSDAPYLSGVLKASSKTFVPTNSNYNPGDETTQTTTKDVATQTTTKDVTTQTTTKDTTPVTSKVWNVSDFTAGEFSSYDGLSAIGSSAKAAVVDTSNVSVDGFTFSQRIKTQGMGDTTKSNVSFNASSAGTLVVYVKNGSSSTQTGPVEINQNGKVIGTATTGTSQEKSPTKIEVAVPTSGTVYIYGVEGGISVYYVEFIANGGSDNPTQTTTQNKDTVVYGDADNDGIVTASDAAICLAKVLNSDYSISTPNFDTVVNVDGDSSLTASDAAIILAKVLNSDYKFAVEL